MFEHVPAILPTFLNASQGCHASKSASTLHFLRCGVIMCLDTPIADRHFGYVPHRLRAKLVMIAWSTAD